MARSVNEILEEMIAVKGADTALADLNSASATALWKLIFYICAVAIYVHECLFDIHRDECSRLLDVKRPHRLKWYRDKALSFQFSKGLEKKDDKCLIPDTDFYDNTGLSESEVKEQRVVKYAAAFEHPNGKLLIKVAGEDNKKRAKLPIDQEIALRVYFQGCT